MTYDKKIVILQSTDVQDSVGNIDCVWTPIHVCWASVNSTGGRRFYEAAQTNTQNYMTFTIRYCKAASSITVDNTHIAYNGRMFAVKHVDDFFERHRELVIKAEEVL